MVFGRFWWPWLVFGMFLNGFRWFLVGFWVVFGCVFGRLLDGFCGFWGVVFWMV